MLLEPGICIVIALAMAGNGAFAQQQHQVRHAGSHDHSAHPAPGNEDALTGFRYTGTLKTPGPAAGVFAYDAASVRLWWISFGPPANASGPSRIHELDPASGQVLASADLGFTGSLASPAYSDGFIFVPVPHESAIYKLAVDRAVLGQVAGRLQLPSYADLPGADRPRTNGESLRFPWLDITALVAGRGHTLIAYASDIGELITLDRDSGAVLGRVQTMKNLGGIAAFRDARGVDFVVANYDPEDAAARVKARRFVNRSPVQIAAKKTRVTFYARRPDDKTVSWVLIEAVSGTPVAALDVPHSAAFATTISLAGYEPAGAGEYGKLRVLAAGPESILTLEWLPAAVQ